MFICMGMHWCSVQPCAGSLIHVRWRQQLQEKICTGVGAWPQMQTVSSGTCNHMDANLGTVTMQPLHPNGYRWDCLHRNVWNTCVIPCSCCIPIDTNGTACMGMHKIPVLMLFYYYYFFKYFYYFFSGGALERH